MIDPPPFSFMTGTTVFIPKKVPVTLIAITLFHRSIEVSSKRVSGEIPALFTKTSILPYFSTTCATMCCHCSSDDTSWWKNGVFGDNLHQFFTRFFQQLLLYICYDHDRAFFGK